MGVAMKQITEPVPRIRQVKSDLPEEIEKVIEKAMAKERENRYATAREMAAHQESFLGQAVKEAPYETQAPPPVGPSRPESPQAELPRPTLLETAAEGSAAPTSKDHAEAPAQAGLLPPVAPPAGGTPPALPAAFTRRKPGRLPAWAWIAGGLIAIIVFCGLLGIALAGGFRLMPGLMAKMEASSTPALAVSIVKETAPAINEPTESPDKPSVSPASSDSNPTPTVEMTYFQDDFSNTESGWFTGEQTGSRHSYDQAGYRILVDRPNIIAWATPALYFKDVSIEVDATKVSGPDENLFGILCRYQDENNFYLFVIGSDAYYEVGKYKDGAYSVIQDTWGYSDAIHKGRTTNRVRADCIGSTLTLYVNDLKLVEVGDSEFADGDVGLTAAAFKLGNTNIWFDNFVARKP
jgi:hypothetical protein